MSVVTRGPVGVGEVEEEPRPEVDRVDADAVDSSGVAGGRTGASIGEGRALQQLHRVPRTAVVHTLADEAHDARMVDLQERVDFAADARELGRARDEDGLERDLFARVGWRAR